MWLLGTVLLLLCSRLCISQGLSHNQLPDDILPVSHGRNISEVGLDDAAHEQEGLNVPPPPPVFLETPRDSYVGRQRPATLRCRAAHVLHVYLRCNGRLMQAPAERTRSELVDPQTGVRQLEVHVDVWRSDVEEAVGSDVRQSPERQVAGASRSGETEDGYKCVCVAWSGVGESVSQPAHVLPAYVKKSFVVPPFSESVHVGATAQLHCTPPHAAPAVSVSWLKNGKPLRISRQAASSDTVASAGSSSLSNYMMTEQGSLVVVEVSLADRANYSCVAENLAARRISQPALLNVYVDGGWSSWTPWSSCSTMCGPGVSQRHRRCDSPPPLHGGLSCVGSSQQQRRCNFPCQPVDGGWAEFGAWSSCDVNCEQHRRRSCAEPLPAHGGGGCVGEEVQSRPCSLPPCSGLMSGLEKTNTGDAVRSLVRSDLTLYMCVAGVLLAVCVVAGGGGLWWRRLKSPRHHSRHQHSIYGLTERDYEARYHTSNKKQLCYTPDLTSSDAVLLTDSASASRAGRHGNALCDINGAASSAPRTATKHVLITSCDEHHYDEPHLALMQHIDNNNSINNNNIGGCEVTASQHNARHIQQQQQQQHAAVTVSSSTSSSAAISSLYGSDVLCAGYAGGVICGGDSGGGSLVRQSLLSSTLPSSLDPDCVEVCTVTSVGAVLKLPEFGVSLTVPENAVAEGHTEEVYIGVSNDAKDRPGIEAHETLLSPVLVLGPASAQLLKPVIVRCEHCAHVQSSPWQLSVLVSDNFGDHQTPHWERVDEPGGTAGAVYSHVEGRRAFIMTDCLQSLVVVGAAHDNTASVKSLRLAAFGPRLLQGCSDYSLRVYVVDDNKAALESVVRLERKLGGRLLDRAKSITFNSSGACLVMSLEDLSVGWKCRTKSSYQEIPYEHVWSGCSPLLHCAFFLEQQSRSHHAAGSREGVAFSARVNVFQNCSDGLARKQMLRISSTESSQSQSDCLTCVTSPAKQLTCSLDSSGSVSPSILPADNSGFRLPRATREEICELLDPLSCHGNDWRLLAQMMHLNRYSTYFAARSSPTDHLLDLWMSRCESGLQACVELLAMLRVMGRGDVVTLMEAHVRPQL